MRVGVVGAGTWGINHVRVLAREQGCELAAVADTDESRRPLVAQVAANARWLSTSELLASDLDGVVISTPAATHVDLAIAALRSGKHVLVEKPLAQSLAAARAIASVARETGKHVMVGHLMVFHPAVRRIRDLLLGGGLGPAYYLHATRVNLGRLRRDETALWCFGPHDLSMIDFILGKQPSTVSACGQAVLQPGVEDVVFATLRYETGEIANLHLSWLHPRKERCLTLVCARKMVEFDDMSPEKLRIYDKGFDRPPAFTQFSEFLTIRDGDVHIPQLSMEEPLVAELRHFLDCIATGRVPDAGLASGLRITAVLEAAQRSIAARGAPMHVEISGT